MFGEESASGKCCHVCGAGNAKLCSGCQTVAYCGKQCQIQDWKGGDHKQVCRQLAARFGSSLFDIYALSVFRPGSRRIGSCIFLKKNVKY